MFGRVSITVIVKEFCFSTKLMKETKSSKCIVFLHLFIYLFLFQRDLCGVVVSVLPCNRKVFGRFITAITRLQPPLSAHNKPP